MMIDERIPILKRIMSEQYGWELTNEDAETILEATDKTNKEILGEE